MKLRDYIQGKRQGKAANELERDALNDPFLQDAIDGFDTINDNHWHAIENLEEKLNQRIKTKENSENNRHWLIGIAASIALLIGFGSLVYFNLYNSAENPTIAKLEVVQENQENSWTYLEEEELSDKISLSDTEPMIIEVIPPTPPAVVVQEVLKIVDDNVETAALVIVSSDEATERMVMEKESDNRTKQVARSSSYSTKMMEIPAVSAAMEEEDAEIIYQVVEVPPSFPGGLEEMNKFIRENLKYPPLAMEISIQGAVYLKLTIRETGKITNIEVVRSVHKSLDDEAIKVVSLMPDWIPAKMGDRNVASYYIIPIRFTLK